MGEKENIEFLIKQHIDKTEEFLDTAQILFENNKFASSLTRSYYAVFHYFSALLSSIGVFPKTHKGLLNQFYQYFVNTDKVDPQVHKNASTLFNMRRDADYGLIDIHNTKDCKEALSIVSNIREVVMKILND